MFLFILCDSTFWDGHKGLPVSYLFPTLMGVIWSQKQKTFLGRASSCIKDSSKAEQLHIFISSGQQWCFPTLASLLPAEDLPPHARDLYFHPLPPLSCKSSCASFITSACHILPSFFPSLSTAL